MNIKNLFKKLFIIYEQNPSDYNNLIKKLPTKYAGQLNDLYQNIYKYEPLRLSTNNIFRAVMPYYNMFFDNYTIFNQNGTITKFNIDTPKNYLQGLGTNIFSNNFNFKNIIIIHSKCCSKLYTLKNMKQIQENVFDVSSLTLNDIVKQNNKGLLYISENCIYDTEKNILLLSSTQFFSSDKSAQYSRSNLIIKYFLFNYLKTILSEREIKEHLDKINQTKTIEIQPSEYDEDLIHSLQMLIVENTIFKNITERVNTIENALTDIRKNYSDLLAEKEALYEKENALRSKNLLQNLTNIENYTKLFPCIKNCEVDASDYTAIVITLYYNCIPIVYIDKNLLLTGIRNGSYRSIFNDDTHKKYITEFADDQSDEKYKLYTAPTTVTFTMNIFNILTDRLNDLYTTTFKTGLKNITNATYLINGHARYNMGNGCLGNFSLPLCDAVIDLDIQKIISLLTQYLETIGAADYAGRYTIEYPIITDIDGNIVYTPDNEKFKLNTNIKEVQNEY